MAPITIFGRGLPDPLQNPGNPGYIDGYRGASPSSSSWARLSGIIGGIVAFFLLFGLIFCLCNLAGHRERRAAARASINLDEFTPGPPPPPYEPTLPPFPSARVANHTQSTSHHGAYHSEVSEANDAIDDDDQQPLVISHRGAPTARHAVGVVNSGVRGRR